MKLKLNTWQIGLLLLPFIIGFLKTVIPTTQCMSFMLSGSVVNLLFTLTELLLVFYQAYLTISFLNVTKTRSPMFRISTLIIPALSLVYFLYLLYLGFDNIIVSTHERIKGPVRLADMNTFNRIGAFFLYYTLFNFFFLNNKIVSNKLNKIQDNPQRQSLKDQYLNPLKTLVRISISVIVGMFVVGLIADILRYAI